ncbi:hypothetical protein DV735_g1308, partial [Chaetothyriales sp. CBS 134920]
MAANNLSLFDTSIPPMIIYLRNLDYLLTTAQAHLAANSLPDSDFLTARIAPDMFPLPFQIRSACTSAEGVVSRVLGLEVPPRAGDETTFEQLHSRIATTISLLEREVKREAFDGAGTREVEFRGLKWSGLGYVTEFAMPNFYFHVVCAYMIFRGKGVNIGKYDYLLGTKAAEARAAMAANAAAPK